MTIAQVRVKASMFNPRETRTRLKRKMRLSALKIDTKTIINMFNKKHPIRTTFISSSLLNILETMLIRLLAMTCEKNSNNPIERVPVKAQ